MWRMTICTNHRALIKAGAEQMAFLIGEVANLPIQRQAIEFVIDDVTVCKMRRSPYRNNWG